VTDPIVRYHIDREDWLAHRAGKIGGTTAAAILGVSPWSSPWDIYAAEVESVERTGPSAEIATRGLELEPVALARWERADRMPDDCELSAPPPGEVVTVERADLPGWSATPDALVERVERGAVVGTYAGVDVYEMRRVIVGGVEVKTVSRSDLGRFWDDDDPEPAWVRQLDGRDVHPGDEGDHIPPAWLVQMLVYLEVTGAEWWDLVILGPHIDQTVILRVHRDPESQARIVRSCSAWWARHIIGREPPPLDDSDACATWARARWLETPRTVTVEATGDLFDVVDQFGRAKSAALSAEARVKSGRALILAAAADLGAQRLTTDRYTVNINKAGAVSAKERK
jgi:hypothetical protein